MDKLDLEMFRREYTELGIPLDFDASAYKARAARLRTLGLEGKGPYAWLASFLADCKQARPTETVHNHATVMDIIMQRLYFGKRPGDKEMAHNGSILKRLHAHHDYETLARAVEGLALRRDRGMLKSVGPTESVSLRWIYDKDQILNQVALSQDEVYRAAPTAPTKRKAQDKPLTVASLLQTFGGR